MAPDPQGESNQGKFPRKPTDDEKKLLAGMLFSTPDINFDDVWLLSELNPKGKPANLDPISFALLCPDVRLRTGDLKEVSGICGNELGYDIPFLYTQKPPENKPANPDGNTSGSGQTGSNDNATGSGQDDPGDTKPVFDQAEKFQQDVVVSRHKGLYTRAHLSRLCTPGLLELYGKSLGLDLDGSKLDKLVVGLKKASETETSGKDQETPVSKPGDFLWMTKVGSGQGVIAHSKEWLDNSKWGVIKARFRFSSMDNGIFYDGLAVHSLLSKEDWEDWIDLMDHKVYDDQKGQKTQGKYEMSVRFKSRRGVAIDILDLSRRNLGHECYFEGEFKTVTLDRIKSCGSVTARQATIETLSLKNAFINKRLMINKVVIDDFNAKGMKCGLVTKEMLDHYKEKHPRSASNYMDDYGFLLWLHRFQHVKPAKFGFFCEHLTLKGQFNLKDAEISRYFELKNCTNQGGNENLDFSGSKLVKQAIALEEKEGESWKTTGWSKEVIEIKIETENVTVEKGEKGLPKLQYTLKIEKPDTQKAYRIRISESEVQYIDGQWKDIIWRENGTDRSMQTSYDRDQDAWNAKYNREKKPFLWPKFDKQQNKNLYHQSKEYFGIYDREADGKKQAAKTTDTYVNTKPQGMIIKPKDPKKNKSKDHN